MTRKFDSLKEIEKFAKGRTLYVRWSGDPKGDVKRGYSRNHATGQAEGGLSVNGLIVDLMPMSRQITEYQHSMLPICCLMTGDEVGRGSDNEPLIINAKVVGIITAKAIEEAHAANDDHLTNKVIRNTVQMMQRSAPWDRRTFARMIGNACGCFPEDVEEIWKSNNVELQNVK